MEKRVVIITGASSGIGLATANMFDQNGFKVYGISRTLPKNSQGKIESFVADVTDSEGLEKCFESIFEKEKRIDVVICNAGFGISGATEFIEKEKTQKQIDVNLIGAIETSRIAIKYLKASGGGKIFFTSSVAAFVPIPFQASYSASKAAINLYSQALGLELKRFNIKVSTVMPGDTKTDFTTAREKIEAENGYEGRVSKSLTKMEKDEESGMSPNAVAKVFLSLANKKNPKPLVCVGFSYKLIAFLAKVLPQRLMLYIVKKMYA